MTAYRLPPGGEAGGPPVDPELDRRLLRFAERWTDRSLAKRATSSSAPFRGGPWSRSELARRIGHTFEATGFRVSMSDLPAELSVGPDGRLDRRAAVRQIMMNPQAPPAEASISGLVVGERALHVDVAGRRRAVRTLGLLGVLTLVLIPGGFLLGYSPGWRNLGALLYLLGGACGITALFTLGWTRVYDSELLVIHYVAEGGGAPPRPEEGEAPRSYELSVGSLRACSRNAGGKFPGRSVRRVLTASPELADVVPQASALLRQA